MACCNVASVYSGWPPARRNNCAPSSSFTSDGSARLASNSLSSWRVSGSSATQTGRWESANQASSTRLASLSAQGLEAKPIRNPDNAGLAANQRNASIDAGSAQCRSSTTIERRPCACAAASHASMACRSVPRFGAARDGGPNSERTRASSVRSAALHGGVNRCSIPINSRPSSALADCASPGRARSVTNPSWPCKKVSRSRLLPRPASPTSMKGCDRCQADDIAAHGAWRPIISGGLKRLTGTGRCVRGGASSAVSTVWNSCCVCAPGRAPSSSLSSVLRRQ